MSSIAPDVLTEHEIVSSRANNAYDAIQLTRPRFLVSRVDLSPLAERPVYLNGIRLGGIGELRGIPASAVHEIRFARVFDVGFRGFGPTGGAILVISKEGR